MFVCRRYVRFFIRFVIAAKNNNYLKKLWGCWPVRRAINKITLSYIDTASWKIDIFFKNKIWNRLFIHINFILFHICYFWAKHSNSFPNQYNLFIIEIQNWKWAFMSKGFVLPKFVYGSEKRSTFSLIDFNVWVFGELLSQKRKIKRIRTFSSFHVE